MTPPHAFVGSDATPTCWSRLGQPLAAAERRRWRVYLPLAFTAAAAVLLTVTALIQGMPL